MKVLLFLTYLVVVGFADDINVSMDQKMSKSSAPIAEESSMHMETMTKLAAAQGESMQKADENMNKWKELVGSHFLLPQDNLK